MLAAPAVINNITSHSTNTAEYRLEAPGPHTESVIAANAPSSNRSMTDSMYRERFKKYPTFSSWLARDDIATTDKDSSQPVINHATNYSMHSQNTTVASHIVHPCTQKYKYRNLDQDQKRFIIQQTINKDEKRMNINIIDGPRNTTVFKGLIDVENWLKDNPFMENDDYHKTCVRSGFGDFLYVKLNYIPPQTEQTKSQHTFDPKHWSDGYGVNSHAFDDYDDNGYGSDCHHFDYMNDEEYYTSDEEYDSLDKKMDRINISQLTADEYVIYLQIKYEYENKSVESLLDTADMLLDSIASKQNPPTSISNTSSPVAVAQRNTSSTAPLIKFPEISQTSMCSPPTHTTTTQAQSQYQFETVPAPQCGTTAPIPTIPTSKTKQSPIQKVKVISGDETCQWRYENPCHLAALKLYVTNIFGCSAFRLEYTDEEKDQMTLCADADLCDAFKCSEAENRNFLKIYVIPTTPCPQTPKRLNRARPLPARVPYSPNVSEQPSQQLEEIKQPVTARQVVPDVESLHHTMADEGENTRPMHTGPVQFIKSPEECSAQNITKQRNEPINKATIPTPKESTEHPADCASTQDHSVYSLKKKYLSAITSAMFIIFVCIFTLTTQMGIPYDIPYENTKEQMTKSNKYCYMLDAPPSNASNNNCPVINRIASRRDDQQPPLKCTSNWSCLDTALIQYKAIYHDTESTEHQQIPQYILDISPNQSTYIGFGSEYNTRPMRVMNDVLNRTSYRTSAFEAFDDLFYYYCKDKWIHTYVNTSSFSDFKYENNIESSYWYTKNMCAVNPLNFIIYLAPCSMDINVHKQIYGNNKNIYDDEMYYCCATSMCAVRNQIYLIVPCSMDIINQRVVVFYEYLQSLHSGFLYGWKRHNLSDCDYTLTFRQGWTVLWLSNE